MVLRRFEDDPNVIEAAADRQMGHLRTYQTGEHADLSQKLLNEVAAARVCLLSEKRKAAYDRQLRERYPVAEQKPPEELDPALAQLIETTSHGPTLRSQSTRRVAQSQLWVAAGAGIVAISLLVIVVILLRGGNSSSNHADVSGAKAPIVQPEGQQPSKTSSLPEIQSKEKEPKPPDTSPPARPLEVREPKSAEPPEGTGETLLPSQPPVAAKPKPRPVPAQAEREKLLGQLNEVYDFPKERTPSEKRKLAADLLNLAEKAKDRPAERHVLLDAAMRLFSEGALAGLAE